MRLVSSMIVCTLSQPLIYLVMDLIKTRPDDPVPTMVPTLSKIIAEADEKAKAEAIKLNN